jgi:hypothetical protein
MKYRMAVVIVSLLATLGCGSSPVTTPTPSAPSVRNYTGTASVGDFFTITLDPNAQTLTYTDLSNNVSGTAAYTENANGTYTLSDPSGNLVAAYEVPNYAMLIQATMTGPNKNTLALVTAVQTSQVSPATFASQKFNYMQFRTSEGGISIGVASMDAQTNVTTSSYWPFGEQNQQGAFNISSMLSSSFQEDASGTFFEVPSPDGPPSYAFGTPSGIFAVDNPNGAILGLQQASSKAFNPAYAATYNAMYYHKVNVTMGAGSTTETGTPSMGMASLVIDAAGDFTMTDSQSGNVMAQGTIQAVADTAYLYSAGGGELADPCNGLFTFRVTTATTQQDVFVTFLNQAVLFGSYKTLPSVAGNYYYNYFYGVALK